jgi:hypothetical protein
MPNHRREHEDVSFSLTALFGRFLPRLGPVTSVYRPFFYSAAAN